MLKLLKLIYLIFLAVLIPMYWKTYGLQNFLWFSDIGLFLTFLGVCFESPLLISMAAVGVLPLELTWLVDYLLHLTMNIEGLGISNYMFEEKYSRLLRSLSFFHIFVPIIWFWLLRKWGYDRRAFLYQTIVTIVVIILTYCFTNPADNINWVFTPEIYHWNAMPIYLWLIILMITIPCVFIFSLHCLFSYIYKKSARFPS